VAGMWLHPEGMEQHPLYANYMDYGPEDRQKRYEGPTLWMFARYGQPSERGGTEAWEKPPTGNPFVEQFPRYFPDLRVRTVPAGHFFAEEAPEATNEALLAFLRE
jgi:pimeloyl-ACP methyl ester carboxylesterase